MKSSFEWPFYALEDDIRPALKTAVNSKKSFVIATLANIAGSSPRPLGSQMLVNMDKSATGYVSGGCVEANIAEISVTAMKEDKSSFVPFGSGSPYMDIKLVCGKRIDVAIDVIRPEDKAAEDILNLSKARKDVLWVSNLETKQHFCIDADDEKACKELLSSLPDDAKELVAEGIKEKIPAGIAGQVYWKLYIPMQRLIINSGNPVALGLSKLARNMDFDIVFNRHHGPELLEEDAVPNYVRFDAETLFKEYLLDDKTAFVTMTHDIDADHEFLVRALPTDAYYVGVLGSKNHMPARRVRFTKAGLTEEHIQKLSAPIGLDIGAANANEIAVAILADIIKTRRKAK